MKMYNNLNIALLVSFSFIVGSERTSAQWDPLPRFAAMAKMGESSERPIQDADGTYNLLSEEHFQTLMRAIIKQQKDERPVADYFTFKVGDTIRTRKLTVLLPGHNREYSIIGDRITQRPDPKNPRYQLYTLSGGNIKLVASQAECEPNAKGQQILISKKTEEYLLTLSK